MKLGAVTSEKGVSEISVVLGSQLRDFLIFLSTWESLRLSSDTSDCNSL